MRYLVGISVFIFSHSLFAHSGHHEAQHFWWFQWTESYIIIFNLSVMTALYLIGWSKMRSRKSPRLQLSLSHGLTFGAALFTLIIALLSPIHFLGEYLNWVHMIQHSLLMMIAAPLLVVAAPGYLAKWTLHPAAWRLFKRMKLRFKKISSLFGPMARPMAIWTLFSLTLWIWHIPRLYESALKNPLLHDLQHLAFFLTGFLFWSILFSPFSRNNLTPGVGIIYLFFASLHSMTLGILMALSPSTWYPFYEERTIHFGITALQDQQLAGYIMWMPAGITYVLAAGYLLMRLLNEEEEAKPLPPF